METKQYTLQDLKEAKDQLVVWRQRWDNYSGNNPNKYKSDIKIASSKVKSIEYNLKQQGIDI